MGSEHLRALVVDGDAARADQLAQLLSAQGHQVALARDAAQVRAQLADQPNLSFCGLPSRAGDPLWAAVEALPAATPKVGYAEGPARPAMVFAIRNGFVDWIDTPFEAAQLAVAVARVRGGRETAPPQPAAQTCLPPSLQEIIQMVRDGTVRLPSLPEAAAKLRSVLNDPDSEPDDIAGALAQEPAVAARVMSVANSAACGGGGAHGDLNTAVLRLGISRVKSMVQTHMLAQTFQAPTRTLRGRMKDLWIRQVTSACVTRALAQKTRLLDPEEAYLLALFRDVGELFLLGVFGNLCGEDDLDSSWTEVISGWHARFSGALVQKWSLGARFAAVARHHHDASFRGRREELAALYLVHVAEHLTERVAPSVYGPTSGGPGLQAALDVLRLSPDDLEELLDLGALHQEATALLEGG